MLVFHYICKKVFTKWPKMGGRGAIQKWRAAIHISWPKQDGPKRHRHRGEAQKHRHDRVGELVVTQIWRCGRCGWDLPRDSLALEKRKTTKQLISIQYIIYNHFLKSNHTTYRLKCSTSIFELVLTDFAVFVQPAPGLVLGVGLSVPLDVSVWAGHCNIVLFINK